MTTQHITVRDATLEDLERIVDYNLRLASESEGLSLDRARLSKGVRGALTQPALCRYFVAEFDGRPVGATMVTYELSDWRCGLLWWLQSVYVEPEFRRRGVFRAVYRHVESLARAEGDVRGIRLYVLRDNHGARRTYESLGMAPSGYEVYQDDWTEEAV